MHSFPNANSLFISTFFSCLLYLCTKCRCFKSRKEFAALDQSASSESGADFTSIYGGIPRAKLKTSSASDSVAPFPTFHLIINKLGWRPCRQFGRIPGRRPPNSSGPFAWWILVGKWIQWIHNSRGDWTEGDHRKQKLNRKIVILEYLGCDQNGGNINGCGCARNVPFKFIFSRPNGGWHWHRGWGQCLLFIGHSNSFWWNKSEFGGSN